jgi:hypothetical protein
MKRTAAATLLLVLSNGCATTGNPAGSELTEGVKHFPLRPYYVKNTDPATRNHEADYYGIRFEQPF